LGYPPAIIYKNERTAYLAYLRRADSGDCGALAEFLVRTSFRTSISSSSPPSLAQQMVPLAGLADDRISANAMRTAATRGALVAVKGPDGRWRSSKRWVENYLRSRHQQDGAP
jgi:hypothetical protein